MRYKGSRKYSAACKRYKREMEDVDNYIHIPDTQKATIILTAYHSTLNVSHVFEFFPTMQHINQYRLTVDGIKIINGKTQNGLFGWSAGLEMLRKTFPRIGRF